MHILRLIFVISLYLSEEVSTFALKSLKNTNSLSQTNLLAKEDVFRPHIIRRDSSLHSVSLAASANVASITALAKLISTCGIGICAAKSGLF